jgi:flagellar protein FlaG
MNNGVSMMSQVQLAQPVVDTAKEFKQAASGPQQRQDVSFDGKIQPTDSVENVSPVIDAEAVEAAVAKIASYTESLGRSLNISVDERSGDFIVRVQNATTEELVRQIPSEAVMRISAAISDQLDALDVMGEEGARGLFLEAVV